MQLGPASRRALTIIIILLMLDFYFAEFYLANRLVVSMRPLL